MNIFFREMKANRKSLIIWGIGVLLMVVGGMGKYGGSAASGQSMNELVAQMPKALQVVIGAGSFDLSTAGGYYGVLFPYLAIMATIHSGMLGANIISKEQRDRTSEFLFVKPVSRTKIITWKLIAATVNAMIFNIITAVSSIAMVNYYGKEENLNEDIIKLMLGMFILQVMFMVIGTSIAAISKNTKIAASAATGILLGTYFLSMGIDMNEKLDFLKYLTPFKYFEAKNLMGGGGFELVFLALSIVIIVALLDVTYIFYKKRDLNV
jgi:ABC-2 type transport system permease protein